MISTLLNNFELYNKYIGNYLQLIIYDNLIQE